MAAASRADKGTMVPVRKLSSTILCGLRRVGRNVVFFFPPRIALRLGLGTQDCVTGLHKSAQNSPLSKVTTWALHAWLFPAPVGLTAAPAVGLLFPGKEKNLYGSRSCPGRFWGQQVSLWKPPEILCSVLGLEVKKKWRVFLCTAWEQGKSWLR